MRWGLRVLFAAIVFLVAFAFGFGWRDITQGNLPNLSLLPSAVLGTSRSHEELIPSRVFSEVLENIQAHYYGDVDRKSLTYAGVRGLCVALGDPHTSLLEPEEAKQFDERHTGEFVGIGAELTRDSIGARIRRVFRGGPASRAGIEPNDVILKVNGREVTGRLLEDVVKDIRGEAGTTVRLEVFRESTKETLKFNIKRARVHIQDVYAEVLRGDLLQGKPTIGKIEVRMFSDGIVQQFDRELLELEKQGIKGLIIDLRGNPGGLLRRCVELCSRFLDGKLIASLRDRNGQTESYHSDQGFAANRKYPIVILIDENSASASEIFAGAMKDWKRATLVGQHTYGKALVQTKKSLSDGAQLKVTIARYYLPGGESIQRIESEHGEYLRGGVQPDVDLKRSPGAVAGDLKTDNQLRKAVEILLEKLAS